VRNVITTIERELVVETGEEYIDVIIYLNRKPVSDVTFHLNESAEKVVQDTSC
jgi:hypothetical protein